MPGRWAAMTCRGCGSLRRRAPGDEATVPFGAGRPLPDPAIRQDDAGRPRPASLHFRSIIRLLLRALTRPGSPLVYSSLDSLPAATASPWLVTEPSKTSCFLPATSLTSTV